MYDFVKFIDAGGLQKLNEQINFENVQAQGELKLETLWPLIYCLLKIFNENKDPYHREELQTFLLVN